MTDGIMELHLNPDWVQDEYAVEMTMPRDTFSLIVAYCIGVRLTVEESSMTEHFLIEIAG